MDDLEMFCVWLVFAGALKGLRHGFEMRGTGIKRMAVPVSPRLQPGSDERSKAWSDLWELHCKLGWPAVNGDL